MILVDTTELIPHTQRQLHAAWQELHGKKLYSPPTVAFEIAPRAVNALATGGPSGAEEEIERTADKYGRRELGYLRAGGSSRSPARRTRTSSRGAGTS